MAVTRTSVITPAIQRMGAAVAGRPRLRADGQPRKKPGPKSRVLDHRKLAEMCAQHAPEIVARLLKIVRGSDDREARQASQEMLDRAFGRPAQSMALTAEVQILPPTIIREDLDGEGG
jgi:hypothetical protein